MSDHKPVVGRDSSCEVCGRPVALIAQDNGFTIDSILCHDGSPVLSPSPEEDFPYRKAALSNAVEAWRDWFWTDGKPDAPAAAAEILGFAEKFLPWLRGEQPEPAEGAEQ